MAAGDWKDMLKARYENDIDLVKYHITKGVNPNYQHPEFLTTPLIESITIENFEIAKYLLENGADPNLKAGFSIDSPILVARKTNNERLILLIESYLPQKKNLFQLLKDEVLKVLK